MTEILQSNFKENFLTLEASLKNAIFVAIDAEFSGIRNSGENPSLFDSNVDRYAKMKGHVDGYIIIQFGLTAFQYDESSNSYFAEIFNVYVFPRNIGTLIDPKIKFQVPSIEFLCRYNFDFNKMVNEGMHYLNAQQEALLRSHLTAGTLLQTLHDTCDSDLENLEFFHEVKKWLSTAVEGSELLLPCPEIVQPYLLHYELRSKYANVWSEDTVDNKQIRIMKVSAETRSKFEATPWVKPLEEEALRYLLGFSHIFSLLCSLKLPIIGHNVLLDLMMTYQQFYEPLPVSYEQFKTKINKLFLRVYDTKLLCHEIKRNIRDIKKSNNDAWDSALPNAYEFLKSKQCEALAPNPPVIKTNAYIKNSSLEEESLSKPDQDTSQLASNSPNNVKQCNGPDIFCNNKYGTSDTQSTASTDMTTAVTTIEQNMLIDDHEIEDTVGDQMAAHEACFHEAGWDSFCSGYVFLRLAHIEAHLQHQQKNNTETSISLTWTHLLDAVKPYENKVHISMGKFNYMNLYGKDKPAVRPPLLHIKSKNNVNLDFKELMNMFARFGSLDIRPYTFQKALLAAPTFGCAIDIVRAMKNHPIVKVEVYEPIRHSPAFQFFVVSGTLLLMAGGLTLLVSNWHK